jgi:hypothetical protein
MPKGNVWMLQVATRPTQDLHIAAPEAPRAQRKMRRNPDFRPQILTWDRTGAPNCHISLEQARRGGLESGLAKCTTITVLEISMVPGLYLGTWSPLCSWRGRGCNAHHAKAGLWRGSGGVGCKMM